MFKVLGFEFFEGIFFLVLEWGMSLVEKFVIEYLELGLGIRFREGLIISFV